MFIKPVFKNSEYSKYKNIIPAKLGLILVMNPFKVMKNRKLFGKNKIKDFLLYQNIRRYLSSFYLFIVAITGVIGTKSLGLNEVWLKIPLFDVINSFIFILITMYAFKTNRNNYKYWCLFESILTIIFMIIFFIIALKYSLIEYGFAILCFKLMSSIFKSSNELSEQIGLHISSINNTIENECIQDYLKYNRKITTYYNLFFGILGSICAYVLFSLLNVNLYYTIMFLSFITIILEIFFINACCILLFHNHNYLI